MARSTKRRSSNASASASSPIERAGAARDDIRAPVRPVGRGGVAQQGAGARLELGLVEPRRHADGRQHDAGNARVQPVAVGRRERRGVLDGVAKRSHRGPARGGVVRHRGELCEEQADPRGALVRSGPERAVLEPPRLLRVRRRAHPGASPVVPHGVLDDPPADRGRRGEERSVRGHGGRRGMARDTGRRCVCRLRRSGPRPRRHARPAP